MGVYVTPQAEIDKYYDSKDLNQSSLKKLLFGLDNFLDSIEKDEEGIVVKEKNYFVIGQAVDCILTGEEEAFSNQFYVSDLDKKPSDAEMAMIQYVFNLFADPTEATLIGSELFIQEASDEYQWYGGKPGEKRIAGLIERGENYIQDLKNAYGKKVLDAGQNMLIHNIVTELRTNPRTAHYFDRETLKKDKTLDVYFQYPIYFKYRGINCKALLDMLIVHRDETGKVKEIEPIDLKTTGTGTMNFPGSVKSFRYDIQAAWYTLGLQYQNPKVTIKPFKFIVASTVGEIRPLIFVLHKHLMEIGQYGREAVNVHNLVDLFGNDMEVFQSTPIIRTVRGFESLLDDYIYYQEQGWLEERQAAENNGVLQIGWDGIM